jgi:TolB-like protein/tRNA A-37 threonylcarbamoyl transferase component Bud32
VKPESKDPAAGRAIDREVRTCAVCGAKFSSTSENWFCPVCALQSALSKALDPVSDSEPGSAETEAGSIVSRFENYEVMLDQDGNPIELGRGAMGITYKAFDVDLRFPVVLKVISEKYVGDEAARQRFLREARAAARVRHPNVASVFRLVKSSGMYFYAMEFVEGETLESLIQHKGRLEVSLTLEIVSQVAAGLSAVYGENLVHRDIKPSNIMVRLWEDGQVTAKIIDLGLAKGVSEPGPESAISTPGAFAGTPQFASPEQFAGLGLDIRSDLYSLGVTLWEMLAGQAPFRGTPAELMYQHQHGPLPCEQLKGLPQPLLVLLELLLAKDPIQRIQSPAELIKAIPLVRDAINAGRSVSPKELRAISGQRPDGRQKSLPATVADRQGLRPGQSRRGGGQLKALIIWSRVGVLVWILAAFLIAGVVIFAVNSVFRIDQPVARSSALPSVSNQASENSIAVLPFESLSENKGDAYFADGVQDEILAKLAGLSQLKVISRTSVMAYRTPSNRDVRSIGAALGVARLVEGTVQRDQNLVRINVELVDARTDETLWSESYERDLTDIFAIQSEIAQTVASKLSARLSPEEKKNIGQTPTTNLEAYDLYLQAKELVLNWGFVDKPDDLPKAIKLLEQATRKDPKFTLAYCLIARANDDLYHYWIDNTPERRALADAAVDEALRLEPNGAEAHLAAAYHLYESYRNYERARVQVELAQQALPNSPEALVLLARVDRRLGRWEESTKALENAYSLDPLNPDIVDLLGANYLWQGRYRESEQMDSRFFELEPDDPFRKAKGDWYEYVRTGDATSWRAALDQLPSSIRDHASIASTRFWSALYARDWVAAKQILDKNSDEDLRIDYPMQMAIPRGCGEIYLAALQGKHPTMGAGFGTARDQLAQRVDAHPDDVALLSVLGLIDAFLGRKQEAIEEATRAIGQQPISRDAVEGPFIVTTLAAVYAWTNESDAAFRELAVLPGLPSNLFRATFKADPIWDPIRQDPRFDKLAAQMRQYQ